MGYQLNPFLKQPLEDLRNMSFGLGFAGKEAKRFLKSFRKGEYGDYLKPELAAGAKRKQEIEQGYGMGSAALVGGNTGEGFAYQALKDRALAASDQQTGFDSINKIDSLYGNALAAGQNAIDSRRGLEMQKMQTLLQAINGGTMKKEPSPWWGVLNAGIGAASGLITKI